MLVMVILAGPGVDVFRKCTYEESVLTRETKGLSLLCHPLLMCSLLTFCHPDVLVLLHVIFPGTPNIEP